jgi:hypothetical protein
MYPGSGARDIVAIAKLLRKQYEDTQPNNANAHHWEVGQTRSHSDLTG